MQGIHSTIERMKNTVVCAAKKHDRTADRVMKRYGKDVLEAENFIESGKNVQHGDMSVREHCVRVAKTSVSLAAILGMKVRRKDLVRGALLHDYFQYDWHSPEHCGLKNLHGFYHPGTALKNAEQEFELTDCERDIIKKHMWPLTVRLPKCKEAWIVTMADKYCSTLETLKLAHGTAEYSQLDPNAPRGSYFA